MRSRVASLLGVGGGVADSYLYAVTNFIPSVAVARTSSTGEFAAFSTVFLTYAIALGGSRAALAEPLGIESADSARIDAVRSLLRRLVVRVAVWVAVVGIAFALVRRFTDSLDGVPVWAAVIVLCFPFHAMQDCARAMGIARHEPLRALASDSVWFLCALVAFVVAEGRDPLTWVSVCWAGGGVLACLVLLPPRAGGSAHPGPLWNRRFSRPSLIEYSLQPAVVQASQLLSGLAGSAASLSALRGGSIAFRPLQLMLVAQRGIVIGGKFDQGDRSRSPLQTGILAAGLGTAAYTVGLWLLPASMGHDILGETWPLVRGVLAPLALAQLLSLTSYAVVTDFKSRQRVEGLAFLRVPGAVAIPVATTVGAATSGASGAAWGLCAGQALATAWIFTVARRGAPPSTSGRPARTRFHERARAGEPPAGGPSGRVGAPLMVTGSVRTSTEVGPVGADGLALPAAATELLIAHEWLDGVGGSENVFRELLDLYPQAAGLCLWNDVPETFASPVGESSLARSWLRGRKAASLPLMARTWARVDLGDHDTVLASSHAFAHQLATHAVRTGRRGLTYVHTPARYLWAPEVEARGRGLAARAGAPPLKLLDRRRTDARVEYVANSVYIKDRIRRAWDREAQVIYPPVNVAAIQAVASWRDKLEPDELSLLEGLPSDFILGASRLVEYKRLDLAILLGDELGLPVVVAGTGPDGARLRDLAATVRVPVHFTGRVSDGCLYALYQAASLFAFLGVEDFGIMPVEAIAAGTPALVSVEGGAAESVSVLGAGEAVPARMGADLRAAALRAIGTDMTRAVAEVDRFSVSAFRDNIDRWVRG